jgi:hypothetical protein
MISVAEIQRLRGEYGVESVQEVLYYRCGACRSFHVNMQGKEARYRDHLSLRDSLGIRLVALLKGRKT